MNAEFSKRIFSCKKYKICVFFLVFFLILCVFAPFSALKTYRGKSETSGGTSEKSGKDALNESIYEQIGRLDLDELQAYLDTLDGFDDQSVGERLISYIGGENYGYGDFFSQLREIFFKDVKEFLPAFAAVGAAALLCGVFAAIRSSSGAKSTENATFFVTFSAVLLPVLTTVSVCFTAAKSALDAIEKQIQLIFPVLLTLMSASGKTATAAIYTPAAAFVSTGAISLVRQVLFPASIAIAAFSVAGNLSPQLKLNRFGAFFKSIYKWLIGIMISVFGLFFTAQGLGAAAYDNAAKRAAKYAIGAGVPIVGGFLSGGFDLALAGGALIKNSVGYLGMLLLLAVLLKPLAMLVSVNVLLRFTAAITQPLGDQRISDFLGETADNVNYVLAGVLMAAFMYFIMLLLCVCGAEAAI